MAIDTRTVEKEISRENDEGNPVVSHLQRQVANALVLYHNYKHYHWEMSGPLFRDLHLMFDEFADAVLATADDFAERLRMIGQNPVCGLKKMQEMAPVQSAAEGTSIREMIEEADANLMVVIRDMRDAAYAADSQHDPGSVDLFSRLVQIHEKHEWFLREVLKRRDGLVT